MSAYHWMGDERRLQETWSAIARRARERYLQPSMVGVAAGYAGRRDEAFEWLERAYRERDSVLPF